MAAQEGDKYTSIEEDLFAGPTQVAVLRRMLLLSPKDRSLQLFRGISQWVYPHPAGR